MHFANKLKLPHFMAAATLAGAAAFATTGANATDYETGMQELNIEDPAGNRDLQGFVWYPTTQTERTVRAHGNQVWQAITVLPDAEPAAGEFPIVVLSHGMFGNARNQAWLAQELVADGYIVAAIDHPGTTTFNRDADERRMMWKRPQDVSRVIDHLTEDWKLSGIADSNQIYAAGHSLGGWTVAALAGAQYDGEAFSSFCEGQQDELVCNIFQGWKVGQDPAELELMQQDLSDDRISAFVLFDMGGAQTFSTSSVAAIDRPTLVYGAAAQQEGALDLDVASRAFVQAMPSENVTYIEGETYAHFDFLGVCTEHALDILRAEVPDDVYVCEDGTDARRAEHDVIAAEVSAFFKAN
ncbi:MAG: alpha/beta fold hydrolase [Pseudomonadota bacterium]